MHGNMYLWLLSLALGWHSSIGFPSHDKDTHIIGGKEAPEGAFPYLGLFKLVNKDKYINYCGGGIIKPQWLLTAGHCTAAQQKYITQYKLKMVVVVGSNKAASEGTRYDTDKIITHEGYDSRTVANDIGMVRTTKEINYNKLVAPIALPDKNTPDNTKCVVAGYGYSDYDKEIYPDTLQMINLVTISNSKCTEELKYYPGRITDKQLCTYVGMNKGTCNGDSGSPLMADDKLIGVVSWGVPCGVGKPDVFTRTYSYLDWINSTLTKNS